MRRRAVLGLLGVLAAIGSGIAADISAQNMLTCSKLGDDAQRLACYDRLAASAAPASPADAFGSPPVAAVPPPLAADAAGHPLDSLRARVVSIRTLRGGTVLNLDNGQQWQQLGMEELLLEVGEGVKISHGAFGSFWLMTEGNRLAHVKRIL